MQGSDLDPNCLLILSADEQLLLARKEFKNITLTFPMSKLFSLVLKYLPMKFGFYPLGHREQFR